MGSSASSRLVPMTQLRLVVDPTQPRLDQLPPDIRREILRHIARAAIRWVRPSPKKAKSEGDEHA